MKDTGREKRMYACPSMRTTWEKEQLEKNDLKGSKQKYDVREFLSHVKFWQFILKSKGSH